MATGGKQDGEECIAHQPGDITMLLVGQTGHGKSATGNSILGRKAFVSKHSPGSVTDEIERAVALRNGRRIEIVDSPGFADASKSKGKEFLQKCLFQAVCQTLPGFNAIVFVLYPDRFTEELVKTVNLFFEFFGDGVGKFAFILFTHTRSKESINEYVNNGKDKPTDNVQVFLDLIERCGSKVLYIDNEIKKEKKQVMVDTIICTIDKNRELLGNDFFTNDMFKEATQFADRYIEENDPTKRIESYIDNDMEKLINKSDDNKPEAYFKRKERVSGWREKFEGGAQRHWNKKVAQTSALVERNISGNDSKTSLKARISGEFAQNLNKIVYDRIKRVEGEQQSATASDIETEVPERRYDRFKDKVINDKGLFERAFRAFRHWFINCFQTLKKLF